MEEQHNLAKWLADEMTPTELEAFKKSNDFETYNKIKKISSELEVSSFDTQKMYQNIMARKKKKKVIKLQNTWFMKTVAVLVIAIGIIFFAKTYPSSTEYALAGEKKDILLPDHSKVVLNSDSEIQYKKWNWNNERNINLKGEAFFKVAKGKKFTVKTSQGTVTVVGTQFNIKSRNKNFEVECYEGKVKVNFGKKSLLLTKGQNVVLQEQTKIDAIPLTSSKPVWMENEIKFNHNSLSEVIEELERQYNISIQNSVNSKQFFTGTLPLNDLNAALKIISKTHHLNYKKNNQEIIITSK